jgi:tetratricopeptide (TPR) repeat protein
LGYLQWTREALRGYPLPIVLWLPAAVSVEIAKRAPDFWSWRGGVFSFGFFAKLDLSKVVLSNNRDFESAPSDISQSSTSVLSVKQLEDSLAEALTTWGENSANIEPIYAQLGSAYAERVWTGKTENLNREIELAETYLNKAIALQKKFDRRYDLAYALSNLGYMYKFLGYWDRAEVLYKESVQIREKLGDQEGIAYIWGQLGYIENIRGNWDAAESLYRQSLQLRTELGDRAGMAESWGLLGDIERNRGNWDAGESLYRQSLQLRTELGDRAGMASSIGSLGEVELSRENLDSAETLLNDALQRCVDLGNLKVMAECNFRLAQVWQKREDLSIAQQYYNQAKTIYQQLGAIKDLERIEKEWEA